LFSILVAVPKISERQALERRTRILDAALRCFERDGFQAATMQDIFREAALSPGAVYTYFFGKDEIVRAAAAEVLAHGTPRALVQLWAEALRNPKLLALVRAAAEADRGRLAAEHGEERARALLAERYGRILERALAAPG
jgi:AcrR family transcriptional regulator